MLGVVHNGLVVPSSSSFSTLLCTADVDSVMCGDKYMIVGPSLYIDNSQHASIETSIIENHVLSTQDIVNGVIIACALAFGCSYLNGLSTSSSFVSWPAQTQLNNYDDDSLIVDVSVQQGSDNKTFNAEDWGEMSKKENYILYNNKVQQRSNTGSVKSTANIDKRENRLTLVALMLLFIPIFSAEFFFALSRQFMCVMGNEGVAMHSCSPA